MNLTPSAYEPDPVRLDPVRLGWARAIDRPAILVATAWRPPALSVSIWAPSF